MESITSRSNPLIVHVRKLLRERAYRRACGEYVCEGEKLLREALIWDVPLSAVICTDRFSTPLGDTIRQVRVPESLMSSLSPMKTPQGVLFVCKLPSLLPPERLTGQTYLLLDGVQDPGNVGTIWRSASAFGADGLLLTGASADPYSWKSVRASMGAAFRLRVWEVEPDALAELCRKSGLPLIGAAVRTQGLTLRELGEGRKLIAVGSEGQGLSETVLSLCQQTITLPMAPGCESLNAAMAASILLWERFRAQITP